MLFITKMNNASKQTIHKNLRRVTNNNLFPNYKSFKLKKNVKKLINKALFSDYNLLFHNNTIKTRKDNLSVRKILKNLFITKFII